MSDSVKRFFNAWGDSDAETRMAVLGDVLAHGVRYADPRTDAALEGVAAVVDYVGEFSQLAPGALAQVVDMQDCDGVLRATVEFTMPGGMSQMGQYMIEADDAGRLTRLVGFKGVGTDA